MKKTFLLPIYPPAQCKGAWASREVFLMETIERIGFLENVFDVNVLGESERRVSAPKFVLYAFKRNFSVLGLKNAKEICNPSFRGGLLKFIRCVKFPHCYMNTKNE